MKTVGNIIWFCFAGIWSWISWALAGAILCLTIIGIPFGLQCFKIGQFGLFPFGKEITPSNRTSSLLLNILWILFFGWELAIMHLMTAVLLCLTIVGIPFALQALKLALISLFPFGATITRQ